jgi:hypothetical protein
VVVADAFRSGCGGIGNVGTRLKSGGMYHDQREQRAPRGGAKIFAGPRQQANEKCLLTHLVQKVFQRPDLPQAALHAAQRIHFFLTLLPFGWRKLRANDGTKERSKCTMQFTIRDLLWLTIVSAFAVLWCGEIRQRRIENADVWKENLWLRHQWNHAMMALTRERELGQSRQSTPAAHHGARSSNFTRSL